MAKQPTKTQSDRAEDRRVEPNHAAVSLPAGSYDFGRLHSGLDKAVDSYDNRDDEVGKALKAASAGTDTAAVTTALPGHKFVEVTTAVDDDGNRARSETIQVFDPKNSEAPLREGEQLPPPELTDDVEKLRVAEVKGEGIQTEDLPTPPPPPTDQSTTDTNTRDGNDA